MFELRVPGKWVLAGEHAVLRGAGAVALPHPEFSLKLKYEKNNAPLQILPIEAVSVVRQLMVDLEWDQDIAGRIEIQSTIPVGSGLGSSAALSVALVRWYLECQKEKVSDDWIREKATQLENRFHGKSSGMDVAAVCSADPIRFVRGKKPESLSAEYIPRFTFHDTTYRARTLDCIAQVEKLFQSDRGLAEQIDIQMALAADWAAEALVQSDLQQLARAMNLAQGCFESWGLMPPGAQAIRDELLRQGALAVKLTGAGGGGFLVALWES